MIKGNTDKLELIARNRRAKASGKIKMATAKANDLVRRERENIVIIPYHSV